MEEKKAEIQATTMTKEEWLRDLANFRARCRDSNDRTNEAQAIKMQGQAIGGFELDNRQRVPSGVAVVVFAPPGTSVATLPAVDAPKQLESTVIEAEKVEP